MKNQIKLSLIGLITLTILFVGCKKDEPEVTPDPTVQVNIPKIDSISTDKTEIQFGGTESAMLTVYCSGGGNLNYEWDVDLGDLIPQNSNASQISFTASPCCIGEKVIRCVATNEKGTDRDSIFINILEP